MKGRPVLVAVIGYIIGILWGLYFRFSIVFYYIPIAVIYYISKIFFKTNKKRKFKLISLSRYSRYLKLIINSKVIFILIVFSIISNGIVLNKKNQYENFYQDGDNIEVTGIIISSKIEKENYNLYKVKILNSKHLNLYIQVGKKIETLEYGDKVKLKGEYKEPDKQRNYGGYNDKQYLMTLKIAGRVKIKEIDVVAKKQCNKILYFANQIKIRIDEKIETNFDKEKLAILEGILLGETQDIQEDIKENFQDSNISHILAISGMHIGYIVIGIRLCFIKGLGKRKTKIITIIILLFYVLIIGFHPSVVRAIVMGIILLGEGLINRKSDILNSMAISLLGILIYNPFLILNTGLQLSYIGTIGIILFRPVILHVLNNVKGKSKVKIIENAKEIIAVSLSVQIAILPILVYNFNVVGIYFLITNLLVSIIICPIIILGFLSIVIYFFLTPMAKICSFVLNIGVECLKLISQFSKLPFSRIYLATPRIIFILIYYICILILRKIYCIYHTNIFTLTQKRAKNLIALFIYKFRQKKNIYFKCFAIILVILSIIHFVPKNLKIYFVDVGQGDCTFIVTPHKKSILIDGGGNLTENFNVGKKTVIPYLLDRGYTKIDYILISHFDQDHVRRITYSFTRNGS